MWKYGLMVQASYIHKSLRLEIRLKTRQLTNATGCMFNMITITRERFTDALYNAGMYVCPSHKELPQ